MFGLGAGSMTRSTGWAMSWQAAVSSVTSAFVRLFIAALLGIPVSTPHTVTGCVIGAGAARRASAVRWGVAGDVAIAWIITIPASATVAAIFYWLISGMWIHVLIAAGLIAFLAYSARAWQVQS